MRDPVVTPSGITYERRDIEEHLQVSILIVKSVLYLSPTETFSKSTKQDFAAENNFCFVQTVQAT